MDDLEYLENCRECRDNEVKALEVLNTTSPEVERLKIDLRKMYALEIIAKELIGIKEAIKGIFSDGDEVRVRII